MANAKPTHCADCGQEIEQHKRRGRPRKRCADCSPSVSSHTGYRNNCQNCGCRITGETYCKSCFGKTKKGVSTKWDWQADAACENCGEEYTAHHPSSRYCSRSCQCKASKARRASQPPTHTCKGCGEAYTPRRADATTYCSRECYFAYIEAEPEPPYSKVSFPVCGECGTVFVSRTNAHLCGDACRQARARRRAREQAEQEHTPEPRKCRECGDTFTPAYGSKRRTFCSRKCSKRWANRANLSNHRERARKYGVRCEPVNVRRVFQRDGWRCQVCGCSTPERLRGTRKRNAPELDHRIPMCAGGAHAYDNVQCACRACNAAKHGHTAVGQFPLFTGA